MTIERALQTYVGEIKANEGRHESIKERAQQDHHTAVVKANGTRDLAVRAADTALERALNETATATARAVETAEAKFDTAVRTALGVPERAFIKKLVGGQLQLWLDGWAAPVAEASNFGPSGWALDGAPSGRQWLGPAGEPQARVGLWRIAASLPQPVPR